MTDETDNVVGLDLHSVNKLMDIATEAQVQEEMNGIQPTQTEMMTPFVAEILVMYQTFRYILLAHSIEILYLGLKVSCVLAVSRLMS